MTQSKETEGLENGEEIRGLAEKGYATRLTNARAIGIGIFRMPGDPRPVNLNLLEEFDRMLGGNVMIVRFPYDPSAPEHDPVDETTDARNHEGKETD